MQILHGYTLLDVAPNAREKTIKWDLTGRSMDNRAGLSGYGYDATQPIIEREFPWFCDGWAEIDEMMNFLETTNGRYQPFYLPTWQNDFEPIGPWTIQGIGYRLTFKPFGYPDIARRFKRRHIARIKDGSVNIYPGVQRFGTDDDGNEYVEVQAAATPAVDDKTIVCFVPLVRLTSDSTEIEWFPHEAKADVILNVTELIAEAPVT